MRPQLEFIFRTLVELRVDMDELRKEFEEYRSGVSSLDAAPEIGVLLGRGGSPESAIPASARDLAEMDVLELDESGQPAQPEAEPERQEEVVVYRPGMTMEDMEREAIVAALAEVDGNRRKAAELLGIGERTLYRKIRKFGLDV